MLFNEGDQVPAIPFIEVVGKGESTESKQIGGIVANVGVMRTSSFELLNNKSLWFKNLLCKFGFANTFKAKKKEDKS